MLYNNYILTYALSDLRNLAFWLKRFVIPFLILFLLLLLGGVPGAIMIIMSYVLILNIHYQLYLKRI